MLFAFKISLGLGGTIKQIADYYGNERGPTFYWKREAKIQVFIWVTQEEKHTSKVIFKRNKASDGR